MDHYFDDIFTRHIGPPKARKPNLRRSSTTRSIGARSDFDISVNGGHEDDARSNSVVTDSSERERERKEADSHVAHYVSEQLERVRSHESAVYENGDEFEAQLDGD